VAKENPAKREVEASEEEAAAQAGKGRPTPSRKEAQAAKAQPLVGGRDKAAVKAQRQKQSEARERARVGMAQGDERYLPARDRGPQRRYVRDYVDARFSVGEFLIPIMIVALMLTFVPGRAQNISIIGVWVFLVLAVVDAIILGVTLKRKLAAKFGAGNVQSGFRWYAAIRAMQFRMLRMPKPQVKRSQYPK
jgi:hypothetical protein